MIKGLGNLPYEERLREFKGDLITMFQYLKGGFKEDGDFLFTRSHMEKTRGNGYKLLQGDILNGHKWKIFHNENNQPLE